MFSFLIEALLRLLLHLVVSLRQPRAANHKLAPEKNKTKVTYFNSPHMNSIFPYLPSLARYPPSSQSTNLALTPCSGCPTLPVERSAPSARLTPPAVSVRP